MPPAEGGFFLLQSVTARHLSKMEQAESTQMQAHSLRVCRILPLCSHMSGFAYLSLAISAGQFHWTHDLEKHGLGEPLCPALFVNLVRVVCKHPSSCICIEAQNVSLITVLCSACI